MKRAGIQVSFLLLISFIFSCHENEKITSQLDEDQFALSFNEDQFVHSFDKVSYKLGGFSIATQDGDYTHRHNVHGELVRSYRNNSIFGRFGAELEVFEHEYDESGFITSSISTPLESDGREYPIYYTYGYDVEGQLSEVEARTDSKKIYELEIEYGSSGLIDLLKVNFEFFEEEYHYFYDSEGNNTTIKTVTEDNFYETFFEYENGLITKRSSAVNGQENTYYFTFEYENGLIKRANHYSPNVHNYYTFEFGNHLRESLYNEDRIKSETLYGDKLEAVKYYRYRYDFDRPELFDEVVDFCYSEEWLENDRIKNTFYNLINDELSMVGYAVREDYDDFISDREIGDTGTLEIDFHNSEDEQIYKAEIPWTWSSDYDEINDGMVSNEMTWNNAQGDKIEYNAIADGWVKYLYETLTYDVLQLE